MRFIHAGPGVLYPGSARGLSTMKASTATLLRLEEIEFVAIRAQGSGGQNVNKVSNAIHLRFDIAASSLPDEIKQKLCQYRDNRISNDGVIIIKAQRFRSLEKNREDALVRLSELLALATHENLTRRATRPTRSSQIKRVEGKVQRAKVKALRGPVTD